MPNHVTNVLEFECSVERMQEIGDCLKGDKNNFFGTVDFNTLIPMPKSLEIEAGSRGEEGYRAYKEFVTKAWEMDDANMKILEAQYKERFKDQPETWTLGKQYFENERNYGATNWYEWCWDHWGTKWNAYDCIAMKPEDKTLIFTTAWDGVPPIVEAISAKFPEVPIRYGWADEDIGYNVGRIEICGGEVKEENTPTGGSKEAYEMAADIMGEDLSEWGLELSKDGTTYEYHEPEDIVLRESKSSKSIGEDR